MAGGDGLDKLVIDGNAVKVNISASEWTNVTGFETIQLVGNKNAAAVSNLYGQNSYNLTLTNALIAANATANLLNIINDNDINNDAALGFDTGTFAPNAEVGVTIDGRQLDATNHFSYNGEEGGTDDRFTLSDANVNGMNVIDGGAVDNNGTATWGANTDVLEVRNSSVVTVGDLANVRNVGILAGSNDQAVEQTMVLQLNDQVVDAMVDSYHTSTTTQQERLFVRVGGNLDVTAPVAAMALDYDGSQITARSVVSLSLDAARTTTNDIIKLGMGLTNVAASLGLDITGLHSAGNADAIVMSASQFGINVGAVDTEVVATGNNIVYGALGSGGASDRVYVVQGGNLGFGGGASDIGIYYDADGSGAGAAILVGVLVDTGGTTLSGAGAGITVVA